MTYYKKQYYKKPKKKSKLTEFYDAMEKGLEELTEEEKNYIELYSDKNNQTLDKLIK